MAGQSVQVIERGLDLIELLATSEYGMSISELCQKTGLPKSTVHRILSTYADRHYVEKNEESSVYCLGHKFVEIASLFLNKIILKTEAAPIMHELAVEFQCVSYLGILEQNEVMYLERAEQFNSLRLYAQIGKREPVYCTALGKVLSAALPENEFMHMTRHLSYIPYTPSSVKNFDEFVKEVEFARINGYAVDREEHTMGSCCLAVPIYDYTRKVMAAMSISGPALLSNYNEDYLAARMKDAAMTLSKRVGYTIPNQQQS